MAKGEGTGSFHLIRAFSRRICGSPHPEHVQHLILVGAAGFSEESDRIIQFRSTWRGAVANFMWDSNFTPQKLVRGVGPWGPALVRKYADVRFGTYASGNMLSEQESKLFTDYLFHTLAGRASGELCLKYIFSLGAFARTPLITRYASELVPGGVASCRSSR